MKPALSSDALKEFLAVATHRSFSRAAKELGVHPSIVSRRIKALEARLGVSLFARHTRSVRLTEAGRALEPAARDILQRLTDAEAATSVYSGEVKGTLRLSCPASFGQIAIAPLLAEFGALHPSLSIDLRLSDAYVDLVTSDVDAAVRIGAIDQGGDLIAVKLADNQRIVCAAPRYLAHAGTPATPEDLIGHRTLHFSALVGGLVWRLSGARGEIDAPIRPALQADNALVLRRAALDGAGVALLAEFLIADDLAAGRLVEVLPALRPRANDISLVYPPSPHLARKVRTFIDFLKQAWAPRPPWARPS